MSGVISEPPAASPSHGGRFGLGQGLAQDAPTDQTIYEAFVVTTQVFDDLSDMSLYFLTGDPTIDLRVQRSIRVAGTPGRLVVGDSVQDGEVRSSLAVAMSLGQEGEGYLIAAIFPPGDWGAEEPDFLRVVSSFRPEVPPGMRAFPVDREGA